MGQHVRMGVLPRLPDRVANAPTLGPHQEVYWDAFQELTTCRALGFGGVGYIPWDAMSKYAEFYGFSHDAAQDFFIIIRFMDRAYVEWVDKQRKD